MRLYHDCTCRHDKTIISMYWWMMWLQWCMLWAILSVYWLVTTGAEADDHILTTCRFLTHGWSNISAKGLLSERLP